MVMKGYGWRDGSGFYVRNRVVATIFLDAHDIRRHHTLLSKKYKKWTCELPPLEWHWYCCCFLLYAGKPNRRQITPPNGNQPLSLSDVVFFRVNTVFFPDTHDIPYGTNLGNERWSRELTPAEWHCCFAVTSSSEKLPETKPAALKIT